MIGRLYSLKLIGFVLRKTKNQKNYHFYHYVGVWC